RKCVYYTATNTVQTTRYLIASAAEFTSGMQYSQHCFYSTFTRFRMNIGRNTTAITDYSNSSVTLDFYRNSRGMTRQRFVNPVINKFPYKMMQTFYACSTNIHSWSFS